MTREHWIEKFPESPVPECTECRTPIADDRLPDDADPVTLMCWGCLWEEVRRLRKTLYAKIREKVG